MNEQQTYVFNQYYIDFLKKIKSLAKEVKETNKDARNILKVIKKHFATMDKLCPDYYQFLDTSGFWTVFEAQGDDFPLSEELLGKEVFTEITLRELVSVSKNTYLINHFLLLLDLFRTADLAILDVVEVVKVLNNAEDFEEKIKTITDEAVVTKILRIKQIHSTNSRKAMEDEMKDIESTSLGKLAKEIMGDIDLEDMQKTMNDPNTNIFESMQNPNSGFGKVLSTVSKKMLTKIGSGELQHDELLKDAISLASKIPNMLPNGMGAQLGNIGAMLEQLQKMGAGGKRGGASGASDTNPMEMMQQMMGGAGGKGEMNPMEMMQQMIGGLNKNQKSAANTRMNASMKKQKSASRLKAKLSKRRAENNVPKEVVEPPSDE